MSEDDTAGHFEYLNGIHGRGHFGTCSKWEAVPSRFKSKVFRFELRWAPKHKCTCGGVLAVGDQVGHMEGE